MTEEQVRLIEIEGVKLEVDLRAATQVERYKVGDRIKILKKDYSGYKVHPGAIVGIDAFKHLPTIVCAYIEDPLNYSGDGGKIQFAFLNAESKDVEICPMQEDDIIPNRDTILGYFRRAIEKAESELDRIRERKEWFLRQYGVAFGTTADDMVANTADGQEAKA